MSYGHPRCGLRSARSAWTLVYTLVTLGLMNHFVNLDTGQHQNLVIHSKLEEALEPN